MAARAAETPADDRRSSTKPRRPVTVTLPERTLARLAAVDNDRATAIVKLVDSALPRRTAGARFDVVEVAPGAAIILVDRAAPLRKIPWLKLAELSPGRHLLTVVPGTPIESLRSRSSICSRNSRRASATSEGYSTSFAS